MHQRWIAGACLLAAVACAPAAAPTTTPPPRAAHPADVAFIQGMIPHHRQALAMAALVPSRTPNEAIRLLAERIEVSQNSEIARMEGWLQEHGEALPAGGDHAHHGAATAGMLTAEAMQRLADSSGADFDRLFVELMIEHHRGALAMVGQLLDTPGGAQDPEVFSIVAEVDSDQKIEIERMYRMLASLP